MQSLTAGRGPVLFRNTTLLQLFRSILQNFSCLWANNVLALMLSLLMAMLRMMIRYLILLTLLGSFLFSLFLFLPFLLLHHFPFFLELQPPD